MFKILCHKRVPCFTMACSAGNLIDNSLLPSTSRASPSDRSLDGYKKSEHTPSGDLAYASSTADISAPVVALCHHVKKTIIPNEIANIASALEPSDSVMFEGLALIDHNSGNLERHYSLTPSASLLILEPNQTRE